jgi:hypothetical protein
MMSVYKLWISTLEILEELASTGLDWFEIRKWCHYLYCLPAWPSKRSSQDECACRNGSLWLIRSKSI